MQEEEIHPTKERPQGSSEEVILLYGDDINDLRVENYLLDADRARLGSAISYITERKAECSEAEDFLNACLEAWNDGNFTTLRARWPDYELFEAERFVPPQLFGAMRCNGLMENGMPASWYEQAEAAIEGDDLEKQIDTLLRAVRDVLPHYSEEDRPLWLEDALITLSIIRPEAANELKIERGTVTSPSLR